MDLYTEIMTSCELCSAWLPGTRQFDRNPDGTIRENHPPRPETELEISIRRKGIITARVIMKTKGCTFDSNGDPHPHWGAKETYNPRRVWGIHTGDGWIYTCEQLTEGTMASIEQAGGWQKIFVREVVAELNWLGVPTDFKCHDKIDFEYLHGLRGFSVPPVVRALYDLMWDAAEHHVHGEEYKELDNIAAARANGMYQLWLAKGSHFLSTSGMTTPRKINKILGTTFVKVKNVLKTAKNVILFLIVAFPLEGSRL